MKVLRYYKCSSCGGEFVQPEKGYCGPCMKCKGEKINSEITYVGSTTSIIRLIETKGFWQWVNDDGNKHGPVFSNANDGLDWARLNFYGFFIAS